MANPEHVAILKQGVEVWNEWRAANPDVIPDLSDAHLENLDLVGAHLSGADLSLSKLTWANLRAADLKGANLSFAEVRACNLLSADLEETDLRSSDLSFSSLINIYSFRNADLKNAVVGSTVFARLDLSEVKNIQTVKHIMPSSIGIDTILKSKGNISKAFLRGCGLPEAIIKLIPKIINQTSDYYTCFISHSTLDQDFCDHFHADLEKKGLDVWMFSKDARMGRELWDEINVSINTYDKVILVCSENSLRSEPVLRELERTLQREEREHKRILFPIRIDDYVLNRWKHHRKADVVRYYIGDFKDWQNPASYQESLDKLIENLKSSKK